MTLFDALAEAGGPGHLLPDRPESMWCKQYAQMMDQWEEMGGVPADLSTVEALVRVALCLWRQHKVLEAALIEVTGATER